MFSLARELKMTVGDLEERMTYEEFKYWKVLAILEKEELEHERKKHKK